MQPSGPRGPGGFFIGPKEARCSATAEGPIRVLIAEDETIIRMDLRGLLEKNGMMVVAEAADGAQAVELARATKPDVAILDLRMPRARRRRGCTAHLCRAAVADRDAHGVLRPPKRRAGARRRRLLVSRQAVPRDRCRAGGSRRDRATRRAASCPAGRGRDSDEGDLHEPAVAVGARVERPGRAAGGRVDRRARSRLGALQRRADVAAAPRCTGRAQHARIRRRRRRSARHHLAGRAHLRAARRRAREAVAREDRFLRPRASRRCDRPADRARPGACRAGACTRARRAARRSPSRRTARCATRAGSPRARRARRPRARAAG